MIYAVECSCTPETEYADGSKPIFYTYGAKAIYIFRKLGAKAAAGHARSQQELVVDPPGWPSVNDWSVRSRREPLSLREYGFYYGVHLNGLHILSIE